MMSPGSNRQPSVDAPLSLHWDRPAVAPRLLPGEIHVWSVVLDRPEPRVELFQGRLCGEERQRASRFHFELDRNRFIVGRGSLRTILGHYAGKDPADLVFTTGPHGKPGLVPGLSGQLFFNLSHSHGLAVCAVACDHEVGIDVEFIRSLPEADSIAARWFSEREQAELRSLPAAQHPYGFFRVWTSKEAYLKATGEGIAEALNQIEVRANPQQPPALLRIEGHAGGAADWSLHELIPAANYVVTLAERAQPSRIVCGEWTRTPMDRLVQDSPP
jgi:4'-phosphopantetheinyl transferase